MRKLSKKHIEAVRWLIGKYREASKTGTELYKKMLVFQKKYSRTNFMDYAFRKDDKSCVLCSTSTFKGTGSCDYCIHKVVTGTNEAIPCVAHKTYLDVYLFPHEQFEFASARPKLRQAFKARADYLESLLKKYESEVK